MDQGLASVMDAQNIVMLTSRVEDIALASLEGFAATDRLGVAATSAMSRNQVR
jgi:hypothetical protein